MKNLVTGATINSTKGSFAASQLKLRKGSKERVNNSAGGVIFSTATGLNGQFTDTGFAGIRIHTSASTPWYSGWIKIEVEYASNGLPDLVDIIQWAYNDCAGQPITAGSTTAPCPAPAAPREAVQYQRDPTPPSPPPCPWHTKTPREAPSKG